MKLFAPNRIHYTYSFRGSEMRELVNILFRGRYRTLYTRKYKEKLPKVSATTGYIRNYYSPYLYWKFGRLVKGGFYLKRGRLRINVDYWHPSRWFINIARNYTPESRYICELKFGEKFRYKGVMYMRSWVHHTVNVDATAYDLETMSAHIFDWLTIVEDK